MPNHHPTATATTSAQLPLRERQRAAVRADLERAALRLFADQGFETVTTEAIAERAGVSVSTLFRNVASKEELLLGVTRRGRAQIVVNFRTRPPDEPVLHSLASAILTRTAQFVDDDETIELWRRAMASAPPALRRASLLSHDECGQLISDVATRLGEEPHAELRSGVLVRATLAAAEYAYEWWLCHQPDESLHLLTRRALEVVTSNFPQPAASRRR